VQKKCVLIIGVRKPCYDAAVALGYEVVLWSDGQLNKSRKASVNAWIEEPYAESGEGLSSKVKEELSKHSIEFVIANTEETVVIGSYVREHLSLPRLAVDVTKRFHNKLIMKNLARKFDIPVTNYKFIDSETSAENLVESLGFPVVIKPVDESGAQDIKIARDLDSLKAFIKPGLLAESFVDGAEVSVETFVQDGKPVFHNITEYLHQWKKSVVPGEFSEDLKAKILSVNDLVIEKFGVDRGVTHAEFYLTKNGPIFGEIAIRPPGGYYMDLINKVYSFDSWQAYVGLSCGEKVSFNITAKGVAAVYMMHPGEGKIKEITGVDEVKSKLKGVFDFSIRKKVGDVLSAHENTSNEVGHILFWAPSREELNADLNFIESTLKFELD
jgi:biotin carboxylase